MDYEKNCCNCKYTDLEPYEAPCKDCSGTVTSDSPLHREREYLWESNETEDIVNHPNHYTNGGMECIDEMIKVFGRETVAHFCLCNVWKYRYRALSKNGQQDIDKSHWYMKKYLELVGDGSYGRF